MDLGEQPWCNDFLKKKQLGYEKFYPLLLLYCNTCNTVQLNYTVKKEIMFSNHTYLSGITKTLSDHFLNVSKEINKKSRLSENSTINKADLIVKGEDKTEDTSKTVNKKIYEPELEKKLV